MSTQDSADQHASATRMDTNTQTDFYGRPHGLEPDSFTAEKLRYASAYHLHMTTRRFFIGPIPEGWLQHHRKHWYRTRFKFRNYTSRTVTFSANLIGTQSPDQSDQEPTSSSARGWNVPLVDTIIQEESDATSGDDEEDDQNPDEHLENLQAIPYPLVEAAEVPTRDSSDTNSISTASRTKSNDQPYHRRENAASTYFTARESNAGPVDPDYHSGMADSGQTLSIPGHDDASQSTPMALPSESGSTTALVKPRSSPKGKERLNILSSAVLERQEPQSEREDELVDPRQITRNSRTSFSGKVAKYRYDDKLRNRQQRLLSRVVNTYDVLSGTRRHRHRLREGEIIKSERMLVRIEETAQEKLPEDYTETDSLRMETRVADSWKEFLVVCRLSSDEEAPVKLQMYKTRVIPEIQKPGSRVKAYHEIPLNRRNTNINIYSPLDKTIVIWRPCKHGTKIHLIRPKSTAHATEWFTLISQALGQQRPNSLSINVPDLGVSLVFQKPFENLETKARDYDEEGDQANDSSDYYVTQNNYAATAIIQGCMKMLENCTEWADVLSEWSKTEQMGLAWKRYDRLEWVLGINEEKMYGSLAMQMTHQLELRPRQHYQTSVKENDAKMEEPQPIEGFLVRLTSQRGVHQRLNKMFFKRLYFFTQDHYLLFCRPAKALPPAPPKLCLEEENIPSARQILDEMPLSYEVNPYPVQDGEIKWLSSGNEVHIKKHDEEACALSQRSMHNLTNTDGFIDLCRVNEVRQVQRGSCPADPNIEEGPDVEFHPETRDTRQDDRATKQFDDGRTLELLLDNGLVVRLQAYDKITRDEWMKRLEALVKYWKARVAADSFELKAIRIRNLDILNMDEEMESTMGQTAEKWETKKSEASPFLHNICALAGCRIIKMSGHLYRKPRRHSTFKRCDVILAAGKLLIFCSSLRNRIGVEVPHIHQNLEMALDLEDCYIYSGLMTESDLLYANQTFDSNHPGHHALPRIYLSSNVYTSCDEDTAITFVIWQPLRKNYFRAQELGKTGQTKQTLKQVSTLGVTGRTVVFKARSRIERDRWVMSIASEIDRLQEEKPQDIRLIKH